MTGKSRCAAPVKAAQSLYRCPFQEETMAYIRHIEGRCTCRCDGMDLRYNKLLRHLIIHGMICNVVDGYCSDKQ